MDNEIFELLVEISNKSYITIVHPKTRDRDQAILEDEKYKRLKYLLNQGLISNINDTYLITEYGYAVSQFNSWIEYLNHNKLIIEHRLKKEKNDLNISEFQIRTKLFPFFISTISIIISVIALINPFKDKPETNQQMLQKTEQKESQKQIDQNSHSIINKMDTLIYPR